MPITKRSGRQELITAYLDINLADVVSGVAQEAMDLPMGAIVDSGRFVTTEAWNSTTSDVFALGDAGSASRYLSGGNIRALAAVVPIVPTGYVHTGSDNKLKVTWTSGGGVPTTGKVRLEVKYLVKGRAAFDQG
jgi:hypothetical protein